MELEEYCKLLSTVLPIFCVISAGAILRWRKILTLEADHSIMQASIYLLYPCLMIDSLLGNPALDQLSNLLIAPAVGLGTVCLGYLIGYLAAARMKKSVERRSFAFTVGMYNYGYLPLPLTMLLFAHEKNRETLGVLFVHNLGVEVAMWGVGIILLTGAFNKEGLRKCLNPPIISLVAVIVLNSMGFTLPKFAATTVHLLGQCAIPLALMVIGAVIIDFVPEFRGKGSVATLSGACFLRLAILPLMFIALARWLPCSKELKNVIVIQAAMPSAVFPIIMAKHYGTDVPTALRVVLGTSFVSLLTIPFWIHWGLKVIAP